MSSTIDINGEKVRAAMAKLSLSPNHLVDELHKAQQSDPAYQVRDRPYSLAWVSALLHTTDIEPSQLPEGVERALEKVLRASPGAFRAKCPPRVASRMSPADDETLIRVSVREYFPDCTPMRIEVDSFPRLGSESLSRVYRVEVMLGEPIYDRRYLFIKIGNPENITREELRFGNYTKVCQHVHSKWRIRHAVASYKDLKCKGLSLALDVADKVRCAPPETLDTRLKNHGPVGWVDDQRREAVLEMFQPQTDLRAPDTSFDWFNEYSGTKGSRAYLDWDKVSAAIRDDFESLLKRVNLKRPGLADPFALIKSLETDSKRWAEIPVKFMTVHGDTHQRNIILQPVERRVVAWPIDFDWSRQFHALVDYTLLEASLKTFYYARYIHPDRMPTLHDHIVANDPKRGDLDLDIVEGTLVDFLRDIRKRSQTVCGAFNSWRTEYHLSSFLVTLGLLTNFGCSPLHAWGTLAWLAGSLLNRTPGAKLRSTKRL